MIDYAIEKLTELYIKQCFKDKQKGKWNMKDKYQDGTPNLEVIGHSNAFEILKKDILKYQKTQKEYKTFLESKGE